MTKGLLDTFKCLDQSVKCSLADISNPRLLALAALELAATEASVDSLSAEHIVACLEAAGVAVKKLSISRSLASANGLIAARREEGEIFYKIMTKGKNEIDNLLSRSKLSVIRIEKNQPRTARLELKETLAALQGEVRICDPYYGIRTLDVLDYIPSKCTIKFLSVNPTDNVRKLAGAIKDFKKERPKSAFRIADKTAGLHDRFVITQTNLIILGHGLKDIGGRESFIINLDRSLVPDLVDATIRSFDQHWDNATIL